MKKLGMMLLIAAMLLCGCVAQPVYEGLDGINLDADAPVMKNIHIDVPKDASIQTVRGDDRRIYFCEGYEIMVETLSGGDLDKSLRSLTGFAKEDLTVVSTRLDGLTAYSCAWTSVGENGEQIGRLTIYDDGAYHYCVSVTAPAEKALKLQPVFRALFDSFVLEAV